MRERLPTKRAVQTALCLIVGLSAGTALAQRAERSALDAAARHLADRVGALQLNATTRVSDLLTEDSRIATALGEALQRARQSVGPRTYSDGSVEIDLLVSRQWVVRHLRELHRAHYRGQRVRATDFERLLRDPVERYIVVTGVGYADSDPEPGKNADRKDTPPANPAAPPGWESVTPQGILLARRAAEMDAQRQLADRMVRLATDGGTTVGGQAGDVRRLGAALRQFLREQRSGKPHYSPEQSCTVLLEVSTEALISHLKKVLSSTEATNDNVEANLDRLAAALGAPTLRAEGHAVAPPRHRILDAAPLQEQTLPSWASEVLRATGTSNIAPRSAGEPGNDRVALALADAHRKIAEQLDDVKIGADRTFRHLVIANDAMRSDLATYLSAIRTLSIRRDADGTVSVNVELPLERLGRIMRANSWRG